MQTVSVWGFFFGADLPYGLLVEHFGPNVKINAHY